MFQINNDTRIPSEVVVNELRRMQEPTMYSLVVQEFLGDLADRLENAGGELIPTSFTLQFVLTMSSLDHEDFKALMLFVPSIIGTLAALQDETYRDFFCQVQNLIENNYSALKLPTPPLLVE